MLVCSLRKYEEKNIAHLHSMTSIHNACNAEGAACVNFTVKTYVVCQDQHRAEPCYRLIPYSLKKDAMVNSSTSRSYPLVVCDCLYHTLHKSIALYKNISFRILVVSI